MSAADLIPSLGNTYRSGCVTCKVDSVTLKDHDQNLQNRTNIFVQF